MKTSTRERLIDEIAMAKKCLADVEAKLARARPCERSLIYAQIERGERFRDDLQAVLNSFEENTQRGKDLLAAMTAKSEKQKTESKN